MLNTPKNWKLVHRTGPDHHKLYLDQDTKRLAIADDSGRYPETTDDYVRDGILWVDDKRPMVLMSGAESCGPVRVHLPLFGSKSNRHCSAITDIGLGLAVRRITGQSLILENEGMAYELVPMTSRESRPLQELAKEADMLQNACNPAGVAGALQRIFAALQSRFQSTDRAREHVVYRVIIDKLMDLGGMDGRVTHKDWAELQRLVEGELSAVEAMGDSCAGSP